MGQVPLGHVTPSNAGAGTGRREIGPADYQAKGVLYLRPEAEFDNLVDLPEGTDLGEAINAAMRTVEDHNPSGIRRGERELGHTTGQRYDAARRPQARDADG